MDSRRDRVRRRGTRLLAVDFVQSGRSVFPGWTGHREPASAHLDLVDCIRLFLLGVSGGDRLAAGRVSSVALRPGQLAGRSLCGFKLGGSTVLATSVGAVVWSVQS